jgi:hypothetical protein
MPVFESVVVLVGRVVRDQRSQRQRRAVRGIRVGEGLADALAQGRLVVFERQHVVGALLDDLTGDRRLAAHRVQRDDRVLEVEQPQQDWDRRDLVRLRVDRRLGDDQIVGRRPGADQMERALPTPPIVRPPQRLAIHGDDLFARCADDGCDPGQEAAAQLLRVQSRKHPAKRVVRGDPARQRQERPQPRFLRTPKRRHMHPVVGPADHRTQRDRHDVDEAMLLQVVASRILQRPEMLADARRRQLRHR